MEKDKEKINEEINENKESQEVANSKEENVDEIYSENNDENLYGYGQLCALLRARYCDKKIQGINKADAMTWRVKDVLDRVKSKLEENK